MPTTKRKQDDLRRLGNAAGQQKISFSSGNKSKINTESSPEHQPRSNASSVATDNPSFEATNRSESSNNQPSTYVDRDDIPGPNFDSSETVQTSENQSTSRIGFEPCDLADIVTGRKIATNLSRKEIYNYFTHHVVPSEDDCLFSKQVTKKGETFKLSYKRKWLTDYSWHVYSRELEGGLCKVCVLFDDPNNNNRGNFVKHAFQNVSKPEKIAEHEKLHYHQHALEIAKQFMRSFETPSSNVDYDAKADEKYQKNLHILKRIIEAVVLCAEQGLPLRGHRDHHLASDDNENFEKASNRGNFIAILEAFAKHDPILLNHMRIGQKSAKMLSWKIQNDVTACVAKFVRERLRDLLTGAKYYAIIADEVTDRYANKEILLLCLRFLNFMNDDIVIQESFLDSVHLQGRPTGQTIATNILKLLKTHSIDIQDCRGQSYDGAGAMKSETKGTMAGVKAVSPKADYTHCRSHTINLSIAFSCKNQSITRFMDNLTSLCYFFANSAKRQQYLELFMELYKDELSVKETKRKEVIGLAKTRWVERHRAYDNYYLLHKFVIACLDSINHPHLYSEFYIEMRNKFSEPWTWDSETKVKSQGLHTSLLRFENMIAFSVLFNGLEPLKPLVEKLQKRNQDIFDAYHMIDSVLADLEATKKDIEDHFHVWYELAVEMARAVGVDPSTPRLAKAWSRFRDNVPSENPESYYRRSVAVPVMDNLVNDLRDRMQDRNHVEIFALLPSVMMAPNFNLQKSASILKSAYADELLNDGALLHNEMIRWKRFWEKELQCRASVSKPEIGTTEVPTDKRRKLNMGERVDGKKAYQISEQPDGLLDCLKLADEDCFPNIRKLLIIGCISPIGSTEAERAASGIRRLKTAYRSTMSDEREGNLNLIQLQRLVNIDVDKVAEIFLEKNKRRLFTRTSVLYDY